MNLTPHIVVTDANAAAAWYAHGFGAEERSRVPLPGGGVMSVELAIGDSTLHIASEFADAGILSPLTIGGTATVLQIETDDADALWARALGAGAEVRHELADQFWGERHGQVVDPFGHRWNIAQRVRDVTPEELAAGAAKALAIVAESGEPNDALDTSRLSGALVSTGAPAHSLTSGTPTGEQSLTAWPTASA